jgi:hypothetical protein
VQLSNPNQKRRAEKIRVAQRNQSSRTNAAALLAPGMFLSSHMRAIVRLLWPGLAGNSITNAQNMRVGASLARETIDVDAAPPPPLVPPPPPLPLPRLVRAAVEPPQIIDLTELDSSDDEEANAGAASSAGSSVVPTIDLTLDDDDDDDHDRHDDNAPHDDIVAIPLVSQ